MNNQNFYQKSLQILNELEKSPKKPSILVHVCCGICPIYPVMFLKDYFNITLYFNNSNIYPFEEYIKRYDELVEFMGVYAKENNIKIDIIKTTYDNENFVKDLVKFKDLEEGKERCLICYEKRMSDAFDYAEANNFDFFTTVMTVSRQKNSKILNLIGEKLEKNHKKTKYFYSDFKKKAGGEIGNAIAKSKKMYIQEYCGCQFSLMNKDKFKSL